MGGGSIVTSTVERYQSASGGRVYRIPLEVFPGLWGNAYLALKDEIAALIDVGSGFGTSDGQLEQGLAEARMRFGERLSWETLSHVLITHGHIDHFGGLRQVAERTHALIGIHELDQRVLSQYEERLSDMAHRLRLFLVEAGAPAAERAGLMELHLLGKQLFSCSRVDFTFGRDGTTLGPLEVMHVPGHCPGQVVFRLDDILISGDHILETISPHMAPERLAPYTGLSHYLESLNKVRLLAGEVSITLGGHGMPIRDLGGRIGAIEKLHEERLNAILDLISEPKTIHELSNLLFPQVEGYHVLLALEETAAHIEYLHQRGYATISNHPDLDGSGTLPLEYTSSRKPQPLLQVRAQTSFDVHSTVTGAAG